MIENVVQLVQEIEEQIDAGNLALSAEEWAYLDRSLTEVRHQLERDNITVSAFEDAAWLVIAAFEENEPFATQFATQLANLTGGTKLTGRSRKPSTKQKQTHLLKNRMIEFMKRAKQEAQNSQRESRDQS